MKNIQNQLVKKIYSSDTSLDPCGTLCNISKFLEINDQLQ